MAGGEATCGGGGAYGDGDTPVSISSSETGWRLFTGAPSGWFEPDGAGSLAWRDSTRPPGIGEGQPADEMVEIVEILGDVVITRVTRTEYPDDGEPCTRVFRVEFTLPSGWAGFLSGLPAPGPSPFSVAGLEIASEGGTLTMAGTLEGPAPSAPVEIRVLVSGADGEKTVTVTVEPDGGGRFSASVETGTGYCWATATVDGHQVAGEGLDCR